MEAVCRRWSLTFVWFAVILTGLFFTSAERAQALNINEYKNVISDSGPLEFANHTLSFVLRTTVSPGGVIEITPPDDFYIIGTSTFSERNVELKVNGTVRASDVVASPGVDQVEITPGYSGLIRYTLAPDFTITSGSNIEIKIGNHTTTALGSITTYSTSTGTTTSPGDVEPIQNSAVNGMHKVMVEVYDGGLVAREGFVIFLNDKVSVPGVDTRETDPPYRFNPTPTSTVGGTTLSVEISLETDELATCRYDTVEGTSFSSMPGVFSNTGLIFHSHVVPVIHNAINRYYVRCIDDEDNYNTDDFVIAFVVNEFPTGTANTIGSTSGDGTGSGNDGTGTGSGGGGESGAADGEMPLEGGSTGSGGSGGGGGGGSGSETGSGSADGFEGGEAPYRSGDARVIISGYAYPNSKVSILVDGNFYQTASANSSGQYSITLDQIARGVYTFGVYAEGSNNIRSSTFSTTFTVSGARTSTLGNVNVSPSILVQPDPVDPGEALTISGLTLPNANVTIQNGQLNAPSSKELTTVSDNAGRWSVSVDTGRFVTGTYQVRAKSAQQDGKSTNYSDYTFYGVGQAADVPLNADLNRDGKVNLIDFSILLFWWNSNGGDSDPSADINRDGKVNLTDFSILLFNWTG